MGNPEHLEIFEQGAGFWNKWRKDNPEIKPDLSEIVLFQKDFDNFNFQNTDFTKAEITQVYFGKSNFN